MSDYYEIRKVTLGNIGPGGKIFVRTSAHEDVRRAFDVFRQSIGSSSGTRTEEELAKTKEELASLERELKAKSPSRKNILSRIRGVVDVAETTGEIFTAAGVLSKAVEAWLR